MEPIIFVVDKFLVVYGFIFISFQINVLENVESRIFI